MTHLRFLESQLDQVSVRFSWEQRWKNSECYSSIFVCSIESYIASFCFRTAPIPWLHLSLYFQQTTLALPDCLAPRNNTSNIVQLQEAPHNQPYTDDFMDSSHLNAFSHSDTAQLTCRRTQSVSHSRWDRENTCSVGERRQCNRREQIVYYQGGDYIGCRKSLQWWWWWLLTVRPLVYFSSSN